MIDALVWLVSHLVGGIIDPFRVLFTPSYWPDFSDPQWIARLIHYGASSQFFFVVFDLFVIVLVIGLIRHAFLWGVVRGIEAVNNTVGRFAAWAGLLMVLQQVMIVALQRIFRVSEISFGPFGYVFTKDLSWFAEELKLYNAMIVTLCAAYTFVQGGHVRVDLFYAGASYRAKRVVDMFGSLFFLIPLMTVIWLFGWSFLWRHLMTPKVSATDTLDSLLNKANLMRWNVETIGFSPNGFNGYFLFKVLLVCLAGLMILQGIAYFYRSLLEFIEGPESEGRFRDFDNLSENNGAPKSEGAGDVSQAEDEPARA
jgi:TRAP-type mannitol/chloroaromatic compound transport system permease small subunit